MKNIFPKNPAKSLMVIDILLELEYDLKNNNTLLAIAIAKGIREDKAMDVINMVKDYASDDRNTLLETVKESTLNKIENL